MSIEEAKRLEVMRRMDRNILTMRRVSEELGISMRQAKRIRKRYLTAGEIGLISKKRGKTSNRKTADGTRARVIDLLTTTYQNFGPTLASEKLEELDQIKDPKKRSNRLVELNVAQQVLNICHTTIVQEAWFHKATLNVHGWVYDMKSGKLKDLNLCISSIEQVESIYRVQIRP